MQDKQYIQGRRRARKLALQALYQELISESELSEIEGQFRAIHHDKKIDFDYFSMLFNGICQSKGKLDAVIEPHLDRAINALNPVELVVLRLGAFELTEVLETPYRVILDESITLAKTFGSQDGHRYVNGILHALAKEIRPNEIQPKEIDSD